MLGLGPIGLSLVIAAFVVGLVMIDGYIYILGKDVGPGQDIGGRIMFTMGQLVTEGGALIERETGAYDYVRLEAATDEDREHFDAASVDDPLAGVLIHPDGEREPLWGAKSRVGLLGKMPFAVTVEKSEQRFNDIEVPDEMPGGAGELTPLSYGGYHVFQRVVPDDGYHVSVKRLMSKLKDAGSPKIADIAKDMAMQKYGGDTGSMQMWKAGLVGLFCAVMGWLMMYIGGGGV